MNTFDEDTYRQLWTFDPGRRQIQRAILLGYAGGRGGAGEGIGFRGRAQAGYICYLPETSSTVVTDDVSIIYDQTTGQGAFPGLIRKAGGGGTIPSSRIPFATDDTSEPDAAAADPDASAQDITDPTGDEMPPAEPTLDFAPGFAPEPSRGGVAAATHHLHQLMSRAGGAPHRRHSSRYRPLLCAL